MAPCIPGEKNLSADDFAFIQNQMADGASAAEFADRYEVAPGDIRQIWARLAVALDVDVEELDTTARPDRSVPR